MCYILGFYKQLLGKIGSMLVIKKIGIKILKDDTCWNFGNRKNLVANNFNNILCASYPWTYRVGTGTILIYVYSDSIQKRQFIFIIFISSESNNFLSAFLLIFCLMKAPKNFEKIAKKMTKNGEITVCLF
jgi:hypothetical protein